MAESNSAGSLLKTMLNSTYSTCLAAIRQPGAFQDGDDHQARRRCWISVSRSSILDGQAGSPTGWSCPDGRRHSDRVSPKAAPWRWCGPDTHLVVVPEVRYACERDGSECDSRAMTQLPRARVTLVEKPISEGVFEQHRSILRGFPTSTYRPVCGAPGGDGRSFRTGVHRCLRP